MFDYYPSAKLSKMMLFFSRADKQDAKSPRVSKGDTFNFAHTALTRELLHLAATYFMYSVQLNNHVA